MKKILLYTTLLFALPFVTLAHAGHDHATTTEMQKKDEISKQLEDTINICAALINKIQDLENRVLQRVGILASDGSLSDEVQDQIDAKRESLDEVLVSANDRVNNNLPKLSDLVLNGDKPAKPVKNFKSEVSKIKVDLINSHKLIVEIIELIKKDMLIDDNTATTTDNER
ncbi:MAG: hypothetical protein Q7S19_03855 [bacterium]|nr:hypothetical protein [bacterium]